MSRPERAGSPAPSTAPSGPSSSAASASVSATPRGRGAWRARRALTWSILSMFLLLGCQVLFGKVEVTDISSGGPGDICTRGEYRCNGTVLLVCGSKDAGWTVKHDCGAENLCDAKDKRCNVCQDGDTQCQGADRQKCASDGSAWLTVESCADVTHCSGDSCGECLTEGALDCSVGTDLRQCMNGAWKVLQTCDSQALCQAAMSDVAMSMSPNPQCAVAACTDVGSYRCDGTVLERCPSTKDHWEIVDMCASPALCNSSLPSASADAGAIANPAAGTDASVAPDSAAVLVMCNPGCAPAGAFKCDGTQLEQCSPDQLGYQLGVNCSDPNTECDPVAGVCGALCTTGQYQCNGAVLRKCGADRKWADQSTCETAALCTVSTDGNTGSCTPSPCKDNPYQCTGATLQKCKADRTGYDDSLVCGSAALCDATSARCIDPTCPTAGAYKCFDQDLKQCAADLTAWKPITTCPAGQYCDNGAGGGTPGCLTACPTNPVRCNGTALQKCDTKTGWTTTSTCATADLCTCSQTSPTSCAAGVGKNGCGNALCGGSLANFQCATNELQKCQAGRNGWQNISNCGTWPFTPNQSLCFPGDAPGFTNGYCMTCPVVGEQVCLDSTGILQICSTDRKTLDTVKQCGGNGCKPVQNGNDYCGVCKEGAVQCSGTALQTCPSDEKGFTTTATCASAALCDVTNVQCDACTANQKRCNGAALQICNADRTGWGPSKTCASAALCDTKTLVCDPAVCKLNDTQCAGAQLQTCKTDLTGFATPGTTCASGCKNGACLACSLGPAQCSAGNSQICSADQSGFTVTKCGTPGCNAATGLCNVCAASTTPQCSGGNSQICNAAQTGFTVTACGAAGCNAASGKCNVCAASATPQCSGGNSQICNAAQTGFTVTTCGAPGCNATTGKCNACSAAAGPSCNGANSQVCNAAQTGFTVTTCGAPGCNAGTGLCNVCSAAAGPSCNGANSQVCNAAQTGFTVTTCGAPGCNATSGKCNVCSATAGPSCNGANSQVCNAAQTGFTVTTCGAAGCNATSGLCNACSPGSVCNAAGTASVTCNATQTGTTSKTCAAGCDTGTGQCKAVVCTASQVTCTGSTQLTCSADGTSQASKTCPFSCNAAGTACNPECDPTNFTPTCDLLQTLTTCGSGGNLVTTQCILPTPLCSTDNGGQCVSLAPP